MASLRMPAITLRCSAAPTCAAQGRAAAWKYCGLTAQTTIDAARNELVEGIIAESEDETLMERYLAGEQIDESVLITDLETAVARGSFHPVIPVCATSQVGLDALLELTGGAS